MSNTFRVLGGPPLTMDDGREVRFGETFDLDELSDDALLNLLLDSGQIGFVIPVIDDPEDDPFTVLPPIERDEG